MASFENVVAATAELSLNEESATSAVGNSNDVDLSVGSAAGAALPASVTVSEVAEQGNEEHKKESASSASSSSRMVLVGDEVPATPKTKQAMREGMYGHLTPQQEEALRSFEEQAKPSDIEASRYTVETVPQVCLRFLRARGFDVAKALALLGECSHKLTEMRSAHWATVDPDIALNCNLAALKNFYPQ